MLWRLNSIQPIFQLKSILPMLLYFEEVHQQNLKDVLYIIVKMKKELMDYARRNGADFDDNENLIEGTLPENKKQHFDIRRKRLQLLLDFVASTQDFVQDLKASVEAELKAVYEENQRLKYEYKSLQNEFASYKLTQCIPTCPLVCNILRDANIYQDKEKKRALTLIKAKQEMQYLYEIHIQNELPNLQNRIKCLISL